MRILLAALMVVFAAFAGASVRAADLPDYPDIQVPEVDYGLQGGFYLRGSVAGNLLWTQEHVSLCGCSSVPAGAGYGYFAIVLLITLITSLLIWASINFGFGGTAKYSQIYAVSLYAGLVMNIKFLLGIIAIFAGLAPDSFIINNPVGSNIGYYMSTDLPLWLRSFCAHIDIFEIWALVLSVIGVSIVARVSKGKAAVVVVGWWIIFILIAAGAAAAQG